MNSMLLSIGTAGIVCLSLLGAFLIAFIVYLCFVPMKSYFVALFSGSYIPTVKLLDTKNRKLDVKKVVNAYILSRKSKLNIKFKDIQNIYACGGDGEEVVKALDFAKKSQILLSFEKACAIEYACHNVFDVVKSSVVSKTEVVDNIIATTIDNFEVKVSARLSLKIDLNKYFTTLGLEDLKGCASSWIMQNIAKVKNVNELMQNPNAVCLGNIDLRVLSTKSMYSVVDINIASVEKIRDINLENEIKAAEKEKIFAEIQSNRLKNAEDMKVIQAKAKVEEKKAEVLEAEANIPKAMAEALKNGNFSLMDYCKLMNLQADTAMRKAFLQENQSSDYDDDEGDDD